MVRRKSVWCMKRPTRRTRQTAPQATSTPLTGNSRNSSAAAPTSPATSPAMSSVNGGSRTARPDSAANDSVPLSSGITAVNTLPVSTSVREENSGVRGENSSVRGENSSVRGAANSSVRGGNSNVRGGNSSVRGAANSSVRGAANSSVRGGNSSVHGGNSKTANSMSSSKKSRKNRRGNQDAGNNSGNDIPTNNSENPNGTANMTRILKRKPGYRALQKIRYYKKSVNFLIPKLPFSRIVRQIMANCVAGSSSQVSRITTLALEALQEAAETFLVHTMEDAMCCAAHSKRVTLMAPDIQLVRTLQSRGPQH